MSFSYTPKQLVIQQMLRGPERHKLIYGGARSGKTFLIVRAMVTRAIVAPKSRHLIARFRANAVRASIALDTLPKVMKLCFPNVPLVEHRQDGFYEFPNGSQLWLGGLDEKERVEKILGQEYVTLFFNECSQIGFSEVVIARTRLAQVVKAYEGKREFILPQRAYYDLNPVGSKHWTNIEFGRKLSPSDGTPLPNPANYVRMNLNPIDNARNLSADTLQEFASLPERQRKRFYEGLYGNDIDGALWPSDVIAKCRVDGIDPNEISAIVRSGGMDRRLPEMRRIVVAIDPSGTSGKEDSRADSVGIVVAGKGIDGRGYVLADRTCNLPPAQWGRVAVSAYHDFGADAIIGESNFGGAMVAHVIQTTDDKVKYKEVKASRGKWIRAEPISALYDPENDKVRHVGRFPELEDQLENFTTSGYVGEKSPDRADAAVWALTDLMLEKTFDLDTFIRSVG